MNTFSINMASSANHESAPSLWPPSDRTVEVTQIDGLRVESDGPLCVAIDRVFPLFDDESLFLANLIRPGTNDSVLDVGTGSGILALAAAQRGGKVLATDVNPRAIACAQNNVRQNGLSDRVRVVAADVYTGLSPYSFDLIVANPPFLPTPPEIELFLSTGGGPDGTLVLSPLICKAPSMLRDGGRFICVAVSMGGRERSLAETLTRNAFKGPDDDVRVRSIYGSSTPIRRLLGLYARWGSTAAWRRTIASGRYPELHYVLIEARRSAPLPPAEEIRLPPVSAFAGSWEARFHRYEAWFEALDETSSPPPPRQEPRADRMRP